MPTEISAKIWQTVIVTDLQLDENAFTKLSKNVRQNAE